MYYGHSFVDTAFNLVLWRCRYFSQVGCSGRSHSSLYSFSAKPCMHIIFYRKSRNKLPYQPFLAIVAVPGYYERRMCMLLYTSLLLARFVYFNHAVILIVAQSKWYFATISQSLRRTGAIGPAIGLQLGKLGGSKHP